MEMARIIRREAGTSTFLPFPRSEVLRE